jgi:general secretion pathway protein F
MQFRIKGIAPSGDVDVLTIDARDDVEAAQLAGRQGYEVLSVAARRFALGAAAASPRFPLLLFSQELLSLLDSGVSIVEAVETLAERESRPQSRRVLQDILRHLREGRPLSAALADIPACFPDLFVAMIRASEKTSDLTASLRRYIAYQSQLDALRSKLVSAAIYPLLLIGVGGLVIFFLLGFVVPRFAGVYEDLGGNLPWLSRLLLEWGQFLEREGLLALALAVGAGFGLWRLACRPALRAWIGARLWRMPRVGERLRIFQLSRCYRTLGMLLRGGIPIVTALEMVDGLLSATLRPLLRQTIAEIREGQPLSLAMERNGLATAVAIRLLRVGEQTGNMGEMMERIAAFHDEETARWTELIVRLFGPLLMLLIGLLIGAIVVLLYMPIFQLAESLG